MSPSPFRLVLALACFAAAGSGATAEPLLKESPFLPPPGAPAPGTGGQGTDPLQQLQLAGLTSVGDQVFASIFDPRRQRSVWIVAGGRQDDIEVVRADLGRDEAEVRIGAITRILTLRRVQVVANPAPRAAAPVVTPTVQPVMPAAPGALAPVAPIAAPERPLTREEQETEARMLVHDLLEIGLQQRKAYEEAQRKAREEARAQSATLPPSP